MESENRQSQNANGLCLQTIPEQESEENKSDVRESDPFNHNLASLTNERNSTAYFNNMKTILRRKPKKKSPFNYDSNIIEDVVGEQSDISEEEGISECHSLSPPTLFNRTYSPDISTNANRGSE